MKQFLVILICILVAIVVAGASSFDHSYSLYDAYVKQYSCTDGFRYKKAGDDERRSQIASQFEAVSQKEFKSFSDDQKLAFLINAYNFYTIELILEKYPVESIKDTYLRPWDRRFVELLGKKRSLNYIEHTMIRENFDEPRIHFAVNCASVGCPPLRDGAFKPDSLGTQLQQMTESFLTDTTRNKITAEKAEISKIFQWYGQDFKNHGGVDGYIARTLSLPGKPDISYLEYDWSLNDCD